MNVLSLFDGMSCGQIALNRIGIKPDKYYAAEIDKWAMQITQKNFPDTIQLGDVTEVSFPEGEIDLLLAGSPCQGFSYAGKQLNFDDPRSALFWEFVRILKETKPKYFLLENVKMKKEYQDVISEAVGCEPVEINSSLVSAQNRKRLYWTNIPGLSQPIDRGILLNSVLIDDTEGLYHTEKAIKYMNREVKGGRTHWDFGYIQYSDKDKSQCLTANIHKGVPYNVLVDDREYLIKNIIVHNIYGRYSEKKCRVFESKGPTITAAQGGGHIASVFRGNKELAQSIPFEILRKVVRKLHPKECERLQTVDDNYTEGVSNTQRYKMLGNGWTVDVIAHILRGMNER